MLAGAAALERGHGSDEFLVSGSSYGQDVRSG
jgi:hypothetical protein